MNLFCWDKKVAEIASRNYLEYLVGVKCVGFVNNWRFYSFLLVQLRGLNKKFIFQVINFSFVCIFHNREISVEVIFYSGLSKIFAKWQKCTLWYTKLCPTGPLTSCRWNSGWTMEIIVWACKTQLKCFRYNYLKMSNWSEITPKHIFDSCITQICTCWPF